MTIRECLIVKSVFIGFDIYTFSHIVQGEENMEKKLVVIKQGDNKIGAGFPEAFKMNGWKLETIELSEGEPLPRSLENFDGLLIISDRINIFEQNSWPLTVYMGS